MWSLIRLYKRCHLINLRINFNSSNLVVVTWYCFFSNVINLRLDFVIFFKEITKYYIIVVLSFLSMEYVLVSSKVFLWAWVKNLWLNDFFNLSEIFRWHHSEIILQELLQFILIMSKLEWFKFNECIWLILQIHKSFNLVSLSANLDFKFWCKCVQLLRAQINWFGYHASFVWGDFRLSMVNVSCRAPCWTYIFSQHRIIIQIINMWLVKSIFNIWLGLCSLLIKIKSHLLVSFICLKLSLKLHVFVLFKLEFITKFFDSLSIVIQIINFIQI